MVRPIPSVPSLAPFIDYATDRRSQAGVYLQDQIKLDRWTLTLRVGRIGRNTEFTSKAFYPRRRHLSSQNDRAHDRPRWPELSVRYRPVALRQLFDLIHAEPRAPTSSASSFRPTTGEGAEIGVKFKPQRIELHGDGGAVRHPSEERADRRSDQRLLQRADRCGARARARAGSTGNVTRELETHRAATAISIRE